jgi:NAD(P)H-hydrate repair Nnr-like enzyme with NAD(P)H-hydrate dehydratase domain
MPEFVEWTERDATRHIRVPLRSDDKYSRGVLGVVTGSPRYPGAAVLAVEAALRTGVGMVRYVGAESVGTLVLQRRPEAVLGRGRAQAWLVGSGIDWSDLGSEPRDIVVLAGKEQLPVILDGGALDLCSVSSGPVLITPHHGELAAMFARSPDFLGSAKPSAQDIARNPEDWAIRAAELWGVTVLLKGCETLVVGPGITLAARAATPWLATAGAGDALGGIIGALVASHSENVSADHRELARIAASAAVIHGRAARSVSGGGPFTILDLCAAIPATLVGLQREFREVTERSAPDYS